ncbi:MAG: hypothetical protein U0S48_16445 [Solirubrobacteraceae bacterium]
MVAAAALRVFDILDDDALLAQVRELGEHLRGRVAQLPGVGEVRGRG